MSAPTPHPQQPGQPQPYTTPHHPGAQGQPAPQPAFAAQPGYHPQPGHAPQQGYAPQPGQAPYAGQPYPQGYPTQGAQPGVPTPPRRSWFARHKILTGLGVVVLVAIIGGALGGGGEDEPTATAVANEAPAESAAPEGEAPEPAPEEPAEEAPAEEPAPEVPATPGIGTAVRDGKFEFTVTSVETGVPSVGDEFLSEQAQGQYVLVHMTVTNIGDEAQMFDGSSQELTDTVGRTHSSDGSAAIYLGDANSFLTDINPGNSVEGTVVFDIPADAVPASIDLHDSFFSGGVEVALG
ncbi:DUF4352 domain-containing protein [Cellulosimicrobium sp. Marseille-Q4280]|uniref:DUF4352 domain-containing protein n=1 Tax=Cellulosimicrobium sp. Marseille-Q4280 TaxID=2937992 RepID=UPI00203C09BC|nr:DUF4352 domain-containing protein [Cellulosimicrobium sp. Marseille-Q4280]